MPPGGHRTRQPFERYGQPRNNLWDVKMARTKGALNKRTRAALSDSELGALGNDTLEFVDRFRKDTRKDDQQRLRAADIVLTYTKPKLSAIEQHMVDDATKLSEAEMLSSLKSLVIANPEIGEQIIDWMKEARSHGR